MTANDIGPYGTYMPSRLRRTFAILALSLCVPSVAAAQAGSATDIIRGTLTDQSGQPVVGAEVTVSSIETGVTKTAQTDSRGRYSVFFIDGGGRYRVSGRAIGFSPVSMVIQRVADEDVLVANLRMGGLPVQLAEIQVQAGRPPAANAEPGADLTAMPSFILQRLPLEGRDPTDAVALTANTVAGLGSTTDSTESEQTFSIGGARTGLNRITLDGLTLGSALSGGRAGGAAPWSIPPEAVRGTQVVVSTYDVSRGQFAGGQVASASARGGNVRVGSLAYRSVVPQLQSGFGTAGGPAPYTMHEITGGVGGALRRNRTLYHVSGALHRRVDHPYALTSAVTDGSGRSVGVASDSIARFLGIAGGTYGVPVARDTGAYDRPGLAFSLASRLDFILSPRHTLFVRGHNTWYDLENSRIGPFDLTQNGGTAGARSRGGFVGLTSQFGSGILNELRAEFMYEGRPSLRSLELPQGHVRVTSDLPDGTRSISTLVFGGERSLPTTLAERRFEATDEISMIWGVNHRLKAGLYFNYVSFTQSGTGNRLGTFTFNSLNDFANRQASSFTRTLDARATTGSGWNFAAYVGDAWRPTEKLQLVYGLRYEVDGFGNQPRYNPRVDSSFALRTDRVASRGAVSPRIGFTLRLSEPREMTFEEMVRTFRSQIPQSRQGREQMRMLDSALALFRPDSAMLRRIRSAARMFAEQQQSRILRGGIGLFRGPAPLGLYANSLNNAGFSSSEGLLVCTGSATPIPDFPAYLANPAAIPTSCAGPPTSLSGRAPQVATYHESFSAPTTLRATLGLQNPLSSWLNLGLDLLGSWGSRLYVARDVNLNTTPAFNLASEGGRPVYSPASAIVPTTGEVPLRASRRDTAFGNVLVLESTGRSWTYSASTRLVGRIRRTVVSANYTLSFTDDHNSFSCCDALQGFASPTTAGNPNVLERSRAVFDRRHTLNFILSMPLPGGLTLAAVTMAGSGIPFTPVAGGDVNGDGVRNDRAFVFDPATATDTSIASAMRRVLSGAPDFASRCLREQLGTVAGRNSCRSPWTRSVSLRVSGRPPVGGQIERRAEFSLDFLNVLSGLDQLVNGSNPRGWGATNQIFGSEPLLYVRGFDPASQSYRYQVNEAFGRPRFAQMGFGNPFQVQLSVRYLVGGGPGAGLGGMGMGAMGGVPGRP